MEKNKHTALLIMDMQEGILAMFPNVSQLLARVSQALVGAREKKIQIIYVTVGFRQGAPEVSINNKGVAAARERFANVKMDDFIKIHPDLAQQNGELTVLKRRLSAFSGSDLELVLRAFDIQHLVLAGVSTSGVVLSTLREAADKDYQLTVLADCCTDSDEEVHRVLITKIFPRQANVMNADEWV